MLSRKDVFSLVLEGRIDKMQEVAIELLNAGLSTHFISRITDLSVEEIEELPRGYSNKYEDE